MFKNKLEVEVAAQRSRTAAKAITRCLVEHKSNVFACIYLLSYMLKNDMYIFKARPMKDLNA